MSRVATTEYTAAAFTVLEGLEAVRKRPSMYIGGVDGKGLHHLVWEIVDNAVDEYLNDYADSITVTLHKSGDAVTITDNGRGIPVDMHPIHKRPGLELILTTLHSGAKFGENETYIHSGGLHGVGSSVVNALSKKLIATIRRDGSRVAAVVRARQTDHQSEAAESIAAARHHDLLRAGPGDFPQHALRPGADQEPSGGDVLHPQRAEDHLPQRRHGRNGRSESPGRHSGVSDATGHRRSESRR